MTEDEFADEMNKVSYEDGDRAWFTMMPNMIDDLSLDVYTFRLYMHLRRVAGENGICFQSTSTMEKWCKMSRHMVIESKKRLVEAKLITIKKVVAKNGGRSCDHIKIVNMWERNYKSYAADKVHPNDIKAST
jgi:hypothetical protein